MKVVQFSSVFNHHSLEFADEMYKCCNGDYFFVETVAEEEQRRKLGYHPYERPYVIKMYENDEKKALAEKLAMDADVMIAGVFPRSLLKKRLKAGKVTFLCQERMFKEKSGIIGKIRAFRFCIKNYSKYAGKNLFLLSIGRYSAADYHSIGFFKKSSFLWAYYPLSCKTQYEELARKKNSTIIELLFVGRLILWKHPDFAVKATEELLLSGYNVHLSVIGNGEMLEELESYVKEKGLEKHISFLGAMPPEKIQPIMEKANIYVFTSNRKEGWGAVLSEAMGTGCAVVASSSAGASVTLIKDEKNGFIYHNDSFDEFKEKLLRLVKDRKLAENFGENAYITMHNEFCATVAAERFTKVCGQILSGNGITEYKSGPMSIIK